MAQVQICRGFGDKDWEALNNRLVQAGNEEDWRRAINIFERRMDERFFSCIRALDALPTDYSPIQETDVQPDRPLPKEASTTPGFAIMALCCLLIETLEFFRAGDECENCGRERSTNSIFQMFLEQRLGINKSDATLFVKGIRHKLVHRSETNAWIVRKNTPKNKTVDCAKLPYSVNRTRLCEDLVMYFRTYVDDLREGKDAELRRHFIEGMRHVAETCRKIKK